MGIETVMVGGTHPDGSSSFNPLSDLIVRTIMGLGIQTPHVYLRLSDHPAPEELELAADYLKNGHNMAQILSDKAIVRAMTRNPKMTEADARMYMCGGCMEISPQGLNGDLLFTGFFNVPKILELVMNGGVCLNTGKKQLPHVERTLADYPDFESFYLAFAAELERALEATFRCMDIFSEEFARLRPSFLLSSQVGDCIERGRNLNDGGARYGDYGSTPLGIPDTADSLLALKLAVYDRRTVMPERLLAALRSNFSGEEALRLELLSLPKYGQRNAEADRLADRVLRTVCDIYDSRRNRFGDRVKPMIMSFTFSPIAGNALGATAAGHKAGTPVAQGLTPHSTSMSHGITSAIGSANSLALELVSGGVTTMWDLDESIAEVGVIQTLLKAFWAGGGQIFQGNTTSAGELRQAMVEPEKFRHLIVRVGGFSAKFVDLSPELQREIANRFRHRS